MSTPEEGAASELPGGEQEPLGGSFFGSPLFAIFMIVFVDVLGMGITIPVLPLYAKNALGAGEVAVGGIVSLYFFAQMIGAPTLGRISDRSGRRPVLLISQAGTFCALILSANAPALWALFCARLLDGFTGGNISTAQAYLSDITDESDRARGLGLMHAAFGAGFVVGPALGGLLGSTYGYRVPFYVAAAVCAVSILLTLRLLPESHTPSTGESISPPGTTQLQKTLRGVRNMWSTPGVPAIWFIGFAGSFAMMGYHSMFVLWSADTIFTGLEAAEVQRETGIIFTILGAVGIMTQAVLVGPAVRYLGEHYMTVIGYALRIVGWGGLIWIHDYYGALMLLMLSGMSGGLAQPALLALLTFATPDDKRGFAIGAQGAVQSAGRVLGPLCTGYLFQTTGPAAVMVVATAANSLAWFATLGLGGIRRKQPLAAEALDPSE